MAQVLRVACASRLSDVLHLVCAIQLAGTYRRSWNLRRCWLNIQRISVHVESILIFTAC